MNAPLKHTIIAMATAALGFAAGCSSDGESPEATEASSGGETATEASCAGATDEGDVAGDPEESAEGGDAEAACGEGSCG